MRSTFWVTPPVLTTFITNSRETITGLISTTVSATSVQTIESKVSFWTRCHKKNSRFVSCLKYFKKKIDKKINCPNLCREESNTLEGPLTEREIPNFRKKMKIDKRLGSDGFTSEFLNSSGKTYEHLSQER